MRASLVLLLCCVHALATTVVIIRTPHEIVIASDSAVQGKDKRSSVSCKIRQAGNIFIATEGMVDVDIGGGNGKSAIGFHAMALAIEAAKHNDSVTDIAAEFQRQARSGFENVIAQVKEVDPAAYKHWILNAPALQIAFAGFTPDKLTAYTVLSFNVSENAHGGPIVSVVSGSCPGQGCFEPSDVRFLGESRRARELSRRPGFPGPDPDLVSIARSLVQAEIDEKPDLVRPPIDSVRLSISGSQVSFKPGCTPMGGAAKPKKHQSSAKPQ